MILSEVIHFLQEQIANVGITNPVFYVMFFTDEDYENSVFYINAGNKIFSGRHLTDQICGQIYSEKGFMHFVERIEKKYLPLINRNCVDRGLRNMVESCEYLPDSYKKCLLTSYTLENGLQFARFIAACILCGNYNTAVSGKDKNQGDYGLGLDFMHLERKIVSYSLPEQIWKASQRAFFESRKEGRRFHDLDIISRLLPKGYVTESNFKLRARTEEGEIRSLFEICRSSSRDIAVTGEGGIGKTTFLQQLLSDEFQDDEKKPAEYATGNPIPIFIELKQCPSQMEQWYEEKHKKTNFISRFIGQLLENHNTLDAVSAETLTAVEKELQRIPDDGVPQYLLLLDGFNEISVAGKGNFQSSRALLSNEITVLHQEYANVRIIATTRETQAAYFTSAFQNVYLIGLEESDIRSHLQSRNFSEASIGIAMASRTLMKCLRIPLFLCMFSYEKQLDDMRLPETPGEILYNFFHRNSSFYNVRMRARDSRNNPLNELQTALVLDFVVPYIGWVMERNDVFSLSEAQLRQTIWDTMQVIKDMILPSDSIPLEDFQYDRQLLHFTYCSLADNSDSVEKIISCIFDYLGILYQYNVPEKRVVDRRQYSFIHHYFRDYFSAILDVQLLRMLPFTDSHRFIGEAGNVYTYNRFLNSFFWNQNKKELVSQILTEHLNRPQMNQLSQNWFLPEPETDEQKVLTDAIGFCRILGQEYAVHYLLHNVLSAVIYGRQELSGMNLTNLNFKHCNIFAVPCSKRGASAVLAAKFDGSVLPDYFLEPEDHVDSIEEYAYNGQYCYTLDNNGTIKCWDILSGCLEYILQSGEPNGISDYSPCGLMKISSDGHWLATKVYNNTATDHSPCLYVFNLTEPEKLPVILKPQRNHRTINSFSFTEDNQSILYLTDQFYVYCFDITTQKEIYDCRFEQFLKQSELYAYDSGSDIYVFSGEYDYFDSADFYPEYEGEDPVPEEYAYKPQEEDIDSDEYWDGEQFPIPCMLLKCDPSTGEEKTLYNFTGVPGTYPVARYFPQENCFILFNESSGQLEHFSCLSEKAQTVWEELTAENGGEGPSSIQNCPGHPQECYIIYPERCYNVSLLERRQNGILMRYDVSALSKLLNDDNEMEELIFYPNVIPNRNRFIIRNSENTYEWDTANDTLIRRYNTALYDCRDLIFDQMHGLGILVHQFNGISVFGGDIPKLVNAFCYPNPEYYVSGCCYHEVTWNLALMFSKASHEYVELINLFNGKREIVFSTQGAFDALESIQFHPDGKYLLITLSNRCVEYNILSGVTCEVEKAGKNELFIDGSYTNDENAMISIAIVEHFNYDTPHIEPHCDHYSVRHTAAKSYFHKEWRYYMPTLTYETAIEFLHYSYDIGRGAAYTKEEYQTYWCTCGFFLDHYPDDTEFQNIRCTRFQGKREFPFEKKFDRLEMIFCRHDFALANPYRTEKNCNNYAYCSDDFSEVIRIFDHHHITFWHNLHGNPVEEKYVYDNGENTSDDMEYVYWDTVIPWDQETLLACYENYHLMLLKKCGQGKSEEIPYVPGIAINGCTFFGAEMNEGLKKELIMNGGCL